jgi:tetratricopeptide (TPR) repeat protein
LGKAEARTYYLEILAQQKDALVLSRLAAIEMDGGDYLSAMERLNSSVRMDPQDTEAQALLAQCKQTLLQKAAKLMEQAQSAFENGELKEAQRLCVEATETHMDGGAAERLLVQIRKDTASSQAELLVEEAEDAAKKKEWRIALQKLRAAHELDPSCVSATRKLTTRVEKQLSSQSFATHVEVGRMRQDQGDFSGALMAYQRALETGTDFSQQDLDNPLVALLNENAERSQTHLSERALEGLASLYTAKEQHAAGRHEDAVLALEEATRHLGNSPSVQSFAAILSSLTEQRRQKQLEGLLERAELFESQGQLGSALAALDEVVTLGLESPSVAGTRKRLKDALEGSERRQKLTHRLERLADEQDWWRLSRELKSNTEALPQADRKSLSARVKKGIQSRWAIQNMGTQKAGKAGALVLPDEFSKEAMEGAVWEVDKYGKQLVGGAEKYLWVGELPELGHGTLYELPQEVRFTLGEMRILPSPRGILLFNGNTRELTTIVAVDNGLAIADHIDLSRHIPAPPKNAFCTGTVEADYCDLSDRLLALVPLEKSRLLSVSVDDGRVHHEEQINAPLFNLQKVAHDSAGRFTVQYYMDLTRPPLRYYNFAVVDGRAKVHKKVLYGDLDELMFGIQRVARLGDLSAELFCQYSYLDPFRGQVVNDLCGFAQMKNDWEIYYSTSRPDNWLGDGRLISTPFALEARTASLLFGWQSVEAGKAQGITSLAIERFGRQWDFVLDPEWQLERLFEERENGRCYALLRKGSQLSVHLLDSENQCIAGLS